MNFKTLNEEIGRLKQLMLIKEAASGPPGDFFGPLFSSLGERFQAAVETALSSKLGKKVVGYAAIKSLINNGEIEEKDVIQLIFNTIKNGGKDIGFLVKALEDNAPKLTESLRTAFKDPTNKLTKSEILNKIPELKNLPDELLNKYLETVGFKPLGNVESILSQITTKSLMRDYPALFQKETILWWKFINQAEIDEATNAFFKDNEGKHIVDIVNVMKNKLAEAESRILTRNEIPNAGKNKLLEFIKNTANLLTNYKAGPWGILKRTTTYITLTCLGTVVYVIYELVTTDVTKWPANLIIFWKRTMSHVDQALKQYGPDDIIQYLSDINVGRDFNDSSIKLGDGKGRYQIYRLSDNRIELVDTGANNETFLYTYDPTNKTFTYEKANFDPNRK